MTVENDVKKLREEFEAYKELQRGNPTGCIVYILFWIVVIPYLADPRTGWAIKAVWNYLFG